MYVLLFAIGLITAAIGAFTLAFGIPNYEFSFGNTLIHAGSVALVGGILQIGLAVIARYLRRIADAVAPRAGKRRAAPAADQLEAAIRPAVAAATPAVPPPQRIPFPPKPEPRPDLAAREPRAPDLRVAPPDEDTEDFSRRTNIPNILPARGGMTEAFDETEAEAVPLAPSRMPPVFRAPEPRAPEPVRQSEPLRAAEPLRPPEPIRPPEPVRAVAPESEAPDLRATPADILSRLSNLAAPPRPTPRAPEPRPGAPERVAERTEPRTNMFEGIWPSESRGPRASRAETVARTPRDKVEPRIEPLPARERPQAEPSAAPPPLMTRERVLPEPQPVARERPQPAERPQPVAAAPVAEPREETPRPATVAILKSGVIDGMAYTLYTDGSIEAQLPQGTMRFASIEELRNHLERAS